MVWGRVGACEHLYYGISTGLSPAASTHIPQDVGIPRKVKLQQNSWKKEDWVVEGPFPFFLWRKYS